MNFFKQVKEDKASQKIRRGIQLLFLASVCFIGFRFAQFALDLEAGNIPAVERPPGVEAFLPISALISLKHFVFTGVINSIHPSGLILFLIICSTALIVKRAFCSWVCPIGFFSELLSKIHFIIFKKGFVLPLWADIPLKGIKYILAGFFIWSILFKMPLESIEGFINSPYNILADMKMFHFFTHISPLALKIIFILIILSVIVRNFWCRYLCPYGALLGVLSLLSIGRIKFERSACIGCGRCEKVCPGHIRIKSGKSAHALECSACLQCVNSCPADGALRYSFLKSHRPVESMTVALIVLILFAGGIGVAGITGHWKNSISNRGYLHYAMTQGMVDMDKVNLDKIDMSKMARQSHEAESADSAEESKNQP